MHHAAAVGIFPSLLGYRIISPTELYRDAVSKHTCLVTIWNDGIKYLLSYAYWHFDLVIPAEGGAIL